MTVDFSERPNSMLWPPLVLVASAAIALALGYLAPMSIPRNVIVECAGYLAAAIGIGLDLWAILTLNKAGTNILPHRGATKLISHGPFGFTRNPIYLGNSILMLGVGLTFVAGWFVVMAIVSALVVDRWGVRPEERHLSARFGVEWSDYASRVPRWLI